MISNRKTEINPKGTLQISFGIRLSNVFKIFERLEIISDLERQITKRIDKNTPAGGLICICCSYIDTLIDSRKELSNVGNSNTGLKGLFDLMLRNKFSDIYKNLGDNNKKIFIKFRKEIEERINNELNFTRQQETGKKPRFEGCLWIPNFSDKITSLHDFGSKIPNSINFLCIKTIDWLDSIIDPESNRVKDAFKELKKQMVKSLTVQSRIKYLPYLEDSQKKIKKSRGRREGMGPGDFSSIDQELEDLFNFSPNKDSYIDDSQDFENLNSEDFQDLNSEDFQDLNSEDFENLENIFNN